MKLAEHHNGFGRLAKMRLSVARRARAGKNEAARVYEAAQHANAGSSAELIRTNKAESESSATF